MNGIPPGDRVGRAELRGRVVSLGGRGRSAQTATNQEVETMPTTTRTKPRRTRPQAKDSPIIVAWFTARAARHLKDEVGRYDGVEIGGGLFGRCVGNALIVEAIGGMSTRVERSTASTEIDIPQCEALARAYSFEWIGFWHLHPEGHGPSTVDLRTAASYINQQTSSWLTVVVVPDEEHGFSGSFSRSPGVISYVTERDATGDIVHRKVGGGAFPKR